MILTLTREMGVNLAGIEVILNMREKMQQMEGQMKDFVRLMQEEMTRGMTTLRERAPSNAIVRVRQPRPPLK